MLSNQLRMTGRRPAVPVQEREERIAVGRIDNLHAGQRGECLHHVVDVGVGACARTGLQVGEDGDFHRREAVQG